MVKRTASLLAIVALLGACGGSTTSGASQGSTSPSASPSPSPEVSSSPAFPAVHMIPDPAGDAVLNPGESPPGYVDSLAMGVAKHGDTFFFAFKLAAPIPASFNPPKPYNALLWGFCLDTDRSSSPDGYPFVNIGPVPCDFIVTAHSEGGPVTGTLIDRRPLADGKEAVTTDIPVTIEGANGMISVPAAQLGDPARFMWAMSASAVTFPLPNNNFVDIDADYEHMHQYP